MVATQEFNKNIPTVVKNIIDDIKRIIPTDSEEVLDVHLHEAIKQLHEYSTGLTDRRDAKLNRVKDKLTNYVSQYPDFNYTMIPMVDGSDHYEFNELYTFKLRADGDIDLLEQFVDNFVTNILNTPKLVPTTQPQVGSPGVGVKRTVTTLDHEVVDTEEQKRKSIETMEKVREDMNKMSESKRQEALKVRTDEIAHYISNTYDQVKSIKAAATKVLSGLTGGTVKLSQVMEDVKKELPFAVQGYETTLRSMIRVAELNLKSKLELAVVVEIDVPTALRYLVTQDKQEIAYLTACNLDFIAAHGDIRPYNIFELITYILDYCDRSSSLTIADTPEEVVDLISGIYDIFVANGLDTEFVYDASMDMKSQVLPDGWYLNNRLTMSYLDKLPCVDLKSEPIEICKLTAIYAQRDILMSYQHIKAEQIESVKQILTNFTSSKALPPVYAVSYGEDRYLIIARDVGSFSSVLIYIDQRGCLSYAIQPDEKSYQKYYLPRDAGSLLKWFEIIMPKSTTPPAITLNHGE